MPALHVRCVKSRIFSYVDRNNCCVCPNLFFLPRRTVLLQWWVVFKVVSENICLMRRAHAVQERQCGNACFIGL